MSAMEHPEREHGIGNPFESFQHKLDQVTDEILRRVQVALLKESTKTGLSRLATLDPDQAGKYLSAIKEME